MLSIRNLSKSYPVPRRRARTIENDPREQAGSFHALREVSFEADPGCVTGILGPNGAGKTTLFRVLATALAPSGGSVSYDGVDILAQPQKFRRQLGFLSGSVALYDRLSVREYLEYFARLYGLRGASLRQRVDRVIERAVLGAFAHRRCGQLSTGMKQRTAIARALIGDPRLLVFDEPTTGLDVAAAETVVSLIAECKAEGKTMLFATHQMREVERLCDRVVVLDAGERRFCGTLAHLRETTGHERLERAFLSVLGTTEVQHVA